MSIHPRRRRIGARRRPTARPDKPLDPTKVWPGQRWRSRHPERKHYVILIKDKRRDANGEWRITAAQVTDTKGKVAGGHLTTLSLKTLLNDWKRDTTTP